METSVRRQVVVTGMGAITSAGAGVDTLGAALRGDANCFREVSLFSTEGLRVHIAGQVEEIPDPTQSTRARWHRASRSDRLARFAVEEALAQSELDLDHEDRGRVGISIGSSTGGILETEAYYQRRLEGAPPGRLRSQLLSSTVGATTDLIASAFGAYGPRLAPSTACSSSAISIAMALGWLRSGKADVVIAGGTDALCRMTYSGFHALQALAPEPCRPFDIDRQGLTLGEGAGALVLEGADHARSRGATILGEVLGAGISCDAAHPTAPHAEGRGAREALSMALEDCRLDATAIAYVNAHGTGTPQNDTCESKAIRSVFGKQSERLPVSSTKGLVGHTLGAAGAIEAIATLIALREGFVPPTVGLRSPDPECRIDLVCKAARGSAGSVAASNSYGFGGNNCSLVLRLP